MTVSTTAMGRKVNSLQGDASHTITRAAADLAGRVHEAYRPRHPCTRAVLSAVCHPVYFVWIITNEIYRSA
jgi:hypothetical protein